MKKHWLLTASIYGLSATLLAACAVGPDYKLPSIDIPAFFKEAPPPPPKETLAPRPYPNDFVGPLRPEDKQLAAPKPALPKDFVGPVKPQEQPTSAKLQKAEPSDGIPKGKWWTMFNDADLSALEEQVEQHNQTVAAAEATWHQSRALVAEARSAYFPTIGAAGSMTRSGSGGKSTSSVITNTGTGFSGTGSAIRNNYSASLDASWVPDFWGQIRREVESSKATAQASAADLANALLSMQAELAIDYLDLRVADQEERVLNDAVKAYTQSLTITQNQYKSGIAASSDVLQAKVQLETTQAQAIDVGVQRAQYEHAIAMLVGKAPANFSITEVQNVPALPEIPTGVPAQLLQRRPDIAAAERRVAAANAQIGVAEAAFFPDITLSAAGGYASEQLAQWFTLPSRFWSIGPSLVETLFDAGLRAAQTEAAIATYDQTVANYRLTVLTAFQEVEDNLAALRIYVSEAAVLDTAVKDAQKTVVVVLNQYKAGTVSYLNVVTAQTAALNDELTALNVTKSRLTDAATLIEDLGGGWDRHTLKAYDITHGEVGPFTILPPKVDKQ